MDQDQYATENIQAMNRAREEEQRYRSLFEQSINAIYTTNSDIQLTDANASMLRLLGYDMDTLRQQSLQQLFATEENYQAFAKKLAQYQFVRNFETVLRQHNGRSVDVRLSIASLTDVDGRVTGYQGVIENISKQKRVQQELIQLEKLMTTGNIARSIAHEVRNPLTNIGLALEQFYTELEPENDLEIYYNIIKRNVQRINELITAMLDSSKPSQLKLTPQPLEQVLEQALSLAEDRLRLQEVTLHRRYAHQLAPLPLDEKKVSMALLNVINNALEVVAPHTGEVTVKTGEDAHYQYVQIADNGPGIEPERLGKLFDAFHTGKPGGMGLGLTATQNIVNSHGGKISVDSTLGKGTVFTLAFKKAHD